jgi:Ca2+-binding RTX toxin-like protein
MHRWTTRVFALAPVLVVVCGILSVPATAGGGPRCFGERATIVGTRGPDVLVGTDRHDVIVALGGDDVVRARGRGDLTCAGGGDDVVRGGRGIDLTFGGGGDDRLIGGPGFFNQAVPGAGDDFVDGGPSDGDEVIYLDAPNGVTGDLGTGVVTGHGTDEVVATEWLAGSHFDDVLIGTDGSDVIYGSEGNDTIDALGGDNGMAGGPGDDQITGGVGFDFLLNYFLPDYYLEGPPAGPITVDLVAGTLTGEGTDTLVGIDGSQGSTGDDVMIGNAEDNEFTGLLEGSDTVDAGAGDDLIDGGEGVDDLDGGTDVDVLGNLDAPAGMTIDLATQTDSDGDTLAGFESALGTFFDDVISGDDGPNELLGADGADQLTGLGGDDVIFGGFPGFIDPDPDTADGGDGMDQCDAETETNCEADPPAPAQLRPAGGSSPARTASRIGYGMRLR